jgi:hypothetical protein
VAPWRARKQVVHARFRQAGMRWSEAGARRLLALRLLLNDNWSLLDNKGIDEEALFGVGRGVEFVAFGGEFGEIFGGFAEYDLLCGTDAVLQRLAAICFAVWDERENK